MTDWLDTLPVIDTAALPTVFQADADRARTDGRLQEGIRRQVASADRSEFQNRRKQSAANAILERLPQAGEVLHLVLDGAFDLCHLIPRVVELGGEIVEALDLMTLGFNDQTIDVLIGLSDVGQVRRIRLLCSHYFKSCDTELFLRSHAELTRRGHTLYVARTHIKAQLYRFASGRCITLLSSANLRSCKNAEAVVIFADAATLRFWQGIMAELIEEARCHAARK